MSLIYQADVLARENIVLLRPESAKYARSRFCRHVLNARGPRQLAQDIVDLGIGLIVGPRKVYTTLLCRERAP